MCLVESCRWAVVRPRGSGPCARRRQSCCVIGDRVFLFGGTSPHPLPGPPSENPYQHFIANVNDQVEARLMDHNDLYVLDFGKIYSSLNQRNCRE